MCLDMCKDISFGVRMDMYIDMLDSDDDIPKICFMDLCIDVHRHVCRHVYRHVL